MLDKEIGLDRKAIGKRIDLLRKKRGLTKTELAKKIGVHLDTVYKWIDGKRMPKGRHLMSLSTLLKGPIDYILFGTKDPYVIEIKETEPTYSQDTSKDNIFSEILNRLAYLDKSDLILLLDLLKLLELKKRNEAMHKFLKEAVLKEKSDEELY